MVDSVKSISIKPESLRSNFKNLSSGLRVPRNAGTDNSIAAETPLKAENLEGSRRVGRIINDLQEAVGHSQEALKALERVASGAAGEGDEVNSVREFANDLEKLRDNIRDVLTSLRTGVDTAEVLRENYSSADSKLRDVEAAESRAAETGSRIAFDSELAIEAHAKLDQSKIVKLLTE